MEGELSCYRGGHFNGGRMVMSQRWCLMEGEGHVTEEVSIMEGEWSCYGGGQFNGGRMLMLQKWSL